MTRVNGLTASSFQVHAEGVGSTPLPPGQTRPEGSVSRTRRTPARGTRPAGSASGPAPRVPLDGEQLKHLVEELNQKLRQDGQPQRRVSLALKGEDQDRFVVEVRDRDSDRVIMQFPPESMLDFSAKIKDIVGMVVDQKS